MALVASKRPDITYLGMYSSTLQLNGVSIHLHHGAGGNSYAISYKLQKLVENQPPGRKAQIFVAGHWHRVTYLFHRNTHAFLPGAFQRMTDFAKRLNLPEMMGGWFITLNVADDKKHTITNIICEFIPFM